ncbi:hypothetical protein [Methylobacterium tardum]|uniref:hypothetical protein n=1 Tax=Methylobacterium tardum TaxID=374432 RepID=UPI003621714E
MAPIPADRCLRPAFAGGLRGRLLAALIGRILYRTFDATWPLQIAVNLGGLALMLGLARLLDARLRRSVDPKPAGR